VIGSSASTPRERTSPASAGLSLVASCFHSWATLSAWLLHSFGWHAACIATARGMPMFSILYLGGAIVVILLIFRVLGLY
jgi:hypothetical protein